MFILHFSMSRENSEEMLMIHPVFIKCAPESIGSAPENKLGETNHAVVVTNMDHSLFLHRLPTFYSLF